MGIIVNYEDKVENNLALSIDRYLKFVLRLDQLQDKKNKKIGILLVSIDSYWNADDFIEKLQEQKYKNIDGIVFLTLEEFPRGDRADSNLNKSRMIREMFENSFNAVTANYLDIIPKACQLVSRVIKSNNDQEELSGVLNEFGKLKEQIVSELNRQKDEKKEIDEYDEKEPLNFLSRFYLLGGIHSSRLGHAGLRELYDSLDNDDIKSKSHGSGDSMDPGRIEAAWKKVKLLETFYDLAFIAASNPPRFQALNILIIDDRPGKVIKDFNNRKIIQYFAPDTEIYITKAGEWKKFLPGHIFWGDMYKGRATIELHRLKNNENSTANSPDNKETSLFKDQEFKFQYVVVDLLMDDYNEGNRIINCLVDFRKNFNRLKKDERTFWDIITFSLSEEAHDISRALNESSLYYVHKSRPFMLPAVIAQLEKSRQILKERERMIKSPQRARGFGKLYRLPELLKRKLRSEPFLDTYWQQEFEKEWELENNKDEGKFIQNLNESIKVPAYRWIKNMPKADLHFHLGGSIIESVFFLSLNMLNDIPPETLKKIFPEIKALILEILEGDWNNIYNLFNIPESKESKESEESEESKKSPLDKIKQLLDKSIPSYQAINLFNVLIGILEGKRKEDIETFWNQLKILKTLEINLKTGSQKAIIRKCLLGFDTEKIDSISEKSRSILNDIKGNIPQLKKSILKHFVSAKIRGTSSLNEYLKGNKFIGSEQLQKKENILAALYLIIKRNIADNIRYLEIRLSPDGYTKSGELTMQEAINALLEYTDLITCYFFQKGQFIRVNYVFCVKRHKPPDQAAIEISAAITNREREDKFKKITPSVTRNNVKLLKYQWKPSKVVGVDLAGKEKENPAGKFVNDFFPLFKTSFFITVHAGEEDTAQGIWEAIYLLHANRIGHGLTLPDYQYLTRLFRDLQICIEMNPISNLLTNPGIEEEYPFYDFVLNGIKVTINTDNQSVSESTLSEEYLKAAELYQKHRENTNKNWISKWDILRVIKNGFSSAFLDREEKRNFMRAVEEEIYQEIIKEYGL